MIVADFRVEKESHYSLCYNDIFGIARTVSDAVFTSVMCVKLNYYYNRIRFPSACTAYNLAFTINIDEGISKVVKVEK